MDHLVWMRADLEGQFDTQRTVVGHLGRAVAVSEGNISN